MLKTKLIRDDFKISKMISIFQTIYPNNEISHATRMSAQINIQIKEYKESKSTLIFLLLQAVVSSYIYKFFYFSLRIYSIFNFYKKLLTLPT